MFSFSRLFRRAPQAEEPREKEKIHVLLITSHGSYFISRKENGEIFRNIKKAPIDFNMIEAAPLGICNVTTDVTISNIMSYLIEGGPHIYGDVEEKQRTSPEKSIDEIFKEEINHHIKNVLDPIDHKGEEFPKKGMQNIHKNMARHFTLRYPEIKKVMENQKYEDKIYSYELREKENEIAPNMNSILLFTIDDKTVTTQDISIDLFSRATRQRGIYTTLNKILLYCSSRGLNNIIITDITCSGVYPLKDNREIAKIRRDKYSKGLLINQYKINNNSLNKSKKKQRTGGNKMRNKIKYSRKRKK